MFEFDVDLSAGQKFQLEYAFKDVQDEPVRDNFNLVFKYNDQNDRIIAKTASGETKPSSLLHVVHQSEMEYDSKWLKRVVVYVGSAAIKLVSIAAQNRYTEPTQVVKLGLLKLSQLDDDQVETNQNVNMESDSDGLSIEWRTQLFRIEQQTYLTIDLKWEQRGDVHFNVFIDSNRYVATTSVDRGLEEPISNFKYVGSTQTSNFAVCLKLNTSLVRLDPTLEGNAPPLAFYVLVQPFREVTTANFSPILDTSKPIGSYPNVVLVTEPRVKQIADLKTDPSFFEKIVDDFESYL